jgi:hypothetical protein
MEVISSNYLYSSFYLFILIGEQQQKFVGVIFSLFCGNVFIENRRIENMEMHLSYLDKETTIAIWGFRIRCLGPNGAFGDVLKSEMEPNKAFGDVLKSEIGPNGAVAFG